MRKRIPVFRKIVSPIIVMLLAGLMSFVAQAQTLEWAKRAGGSSHDYVDSITALSDGSTLTLITGAYWGTSTFGPGESSETTLPAAGGYYDIFIAKYNGDGTLAWAKSAGGSGDYDWSHGIAALSDGSSVVTGRFDAAATFGPGESAQTNLTSAGNGDIFVAKYNADGTLAWAKRAGSSDYERGLAVTVLSDGSAVVTGAFRGTATFGPGEGGQTNLTSAGYNDIFIAKYNSNGTLAWAKHAGGTSEDQGNGVAVLSDGSALVTGQFNGSATFGPGESAQTVLSSAGASDIFIAKYNSDGTLAWAKRAGGSSSNQDIGTSIAALSDGSSLVTGIFWGTATFGPGESSQTNLTSAGLYEIFVAKYSSDGTLAWAKRAGGTDTDRGNSISALSDGSAFVTGYFKSTATFGPGESGQTNLSSSGSYDIFIAKYNSDGTLAWAKRAGGTGDKDMGESIAALSDGRAVFTGTFNGSATFGPGESGQTVLTSAGWGDVFIAKYSPLSVTPTPTPSPTPTVTPSPTPTPTATPTPTPSPTPSPTPTSTPTPSPTPTLTPTPTPSPTPTPTPTMTPSPQPMSSFLILSWAEQAGGGYTDSGYSIAALSDGSALVTGVLRGSATFGAGESGEVILTSAGECDVFIAKYNPDSTLAWAKRAGGTSFDSAYGIAGLSDGSAVVTGSFAETATFGPGESGETALTSAGSGDMFVAKYNPDGSLAWARRAGGTDGDVGKSIAVLADGSSFITGSFTGSATFGQGETNETSLAAAGWYDIFVAKYNPDGTLAWARQAGGAYWDLGNSIAVLPDGSSLITGYFYGSATFGPGESGETEPTPYGYQDIFVAKYNPDGTLAWVTSAGTMDAEIGNAIAVLPDGSALVTGEFRGTPTFGSGETNETILTSAGSDDIFIAKYNPEGTLAWAKRAGGSGTDVSNAIAVLSDGSPAVTGYFGGSATFGPGESNQIVATSAGNWDMFIAVYNPDGTLAGVEQAGGGGDERGKSLAPCSGVSLLVAGYFDGTATFGQGQSSETILISTGGENIFIAKYLFPSTQADNWLLYY